MEATQEQTDWTRGHDAATQVLTDIAPELRDEFIAEELSAEGRARGREISEETEAFNRGWEAALGAPES